MQNRQGKTRLSKFYVPYEEDEKSRIRGEVHRLIAPRDQKYQSNFVEVNATPSPSLGLSHRRGADTTDMARLAVPEPQDRLPKIRRALLQHVRRRQRQRTRVARIHPPLCRSPRQVSRPLSSSQTCLGGPYLHNTKKGVANRPKTDAFFGNVCELDLVFNFYKVYAILDECFLAGEVEETSKKVILERLDYLDKLE